MFVQGTVDQFDYPKKGKNIPPSKHDAPPKEVPPQNEEQEGEEGEAQSYYDENGERVEVQEGQDGEYGDEG